LQARVKDAELLLETLSGIFQAPDFSSLPRLASKVIIQYYTNQLVFFLASTSYLAKKGDLERSQWLILCMPELFHNLIP
jgi:hypothetical protein